MGERAWEIMVVIRLVPRTGAVEAAVVALRLSGQMHLVIMLNQVRSLVRVVTVA